MKRIFLFLCLISFHQLMAQKEAWHWYFGANAGIDFSSGTATLVSGSLATYEGCASISDSSGSLLFYTDGMNVYDRNNSQMLNGFGLFGDPSSTQSSIIVKLPGSTTIFYIFTVDYNFGINGFCYSIVDMTMNAGYGDVTTKNVPVLAPEYEKLTAIKNGNNTDYWILINDWTNDDIYAYAFTSAGLNTVPVVSGIGPFHNLWIGATGGYMKANRQGNKLALAMWDKNSFDLCDFDNTTGLASNHIVVQNPDMVYTYGLEFSPDGRYLYGTNMNPPCHLYQFDLSSGTASGILNSRVTLDSSNVLYRYSALQVAPDGKIYCAHRNDFYAGVINDPDSGGFLCNYADSGFTTYPYVDWLGLPNFPADYFQSSLPVAAVQSDTSVCQENCIDFFDMSSNNPVAWHWYFPGGNPSSSSLQNPSQVCYSTPGTYDVALVVSNANGTDSIFLPGYITVFPTPPAPSISQSSDTLFCHNASNYSSFQWFYFGVAINGATDSTYIANLDGTYQVEVHDSNGCRALVSTTFISGIEENTGQKEFWIETFAGMNIATLHAPSIHQNETVNITLYDALGQIILDEKSLKWHGEKKIDLELLGAGIYYVTLKSESTRYSGKLIRQ